MIARLVGMIARLVGISQRESKSKDGIGNQTPDIFT